MTRNTIQSGPTDGLGSRLKYVRSVIGCAGLAGSQGFPVATVLTRYAQLSPVVFFTNDLDVIHPQYDEGPSASRILGLFNHEPEFVNGELRLPIITGSQEPLDYMVFWRAYFEELLSYPAVRMRDLRITGFWGTMRYLGTDAYAPNLAALLSTFWIAAAEYLNFGIPFAVMASHFPQATGNAMRAGVPAIAAAVPAHMRRYVRFMTGMTEGGLDTTDWVDIPSLVDFHTQLQAAGFATGVYVRTFGDPDSNERLTEYSKVVEYFNLMPV